VEPAKGNERTLIAALEQEFSRLHNQFCAMVLRLPDASLYATPDSHLESKTAAVVEKVLRAAAVVERTFGGLTANLWDDPFEWTLPETLTTIESIVNYLKEVEATRTRAFASFKTDDDLKKIISGPDSDLRPLANLLCETLTTAEFYHGQAVGVAKLHSPSGTAGFII